MKSYLLSVWNALDPIYFRMTRLHYVTDHEQQNTLFRVRLTRYKGKSAVLSDGTIINKNDLLIKIHLHNVKMLRDLNQINSEMKRGVYVYHMIKRSLPRLANFVRMHQKTNEIKGIIGITTLYRGADQLGFEIYPISNFYYILYKKLTFLPINFLGNTPCLQQPVYLFMSKEQLLKLGF
ncbi:YkoP family protein [Virgibacillus sp. FSP13]